MLVCADPYDKRDIFTSLDKAWELLRQFPPESLKQITPDIRNMFYNRENALKNMYPTEKKYVHPFTMRVWCMHSMYSCYAVCDCTTPGRSTSTRSLQPSRARPA